MSKAVYMYTHWQNPDLSAAFVLWNLIFLYKSCLCSFFFFKQIIIYDLYSVGDYICILPQHVLLTAVIVLRKAYVPLFFSGIWFRCSIWFSVKPFSYKFSSWADWGARKLKVGPKIIQWVRGSKRIKGMSFDPGIFCLNLSWTNQF